MKFTFARYPRHACSNLRNVNTRDIVNVFVRDTSWWTYLNWRKTSHLQETFAIGQYSSRFRKNNEYGDGYWTFEVLVPIPKQYLVPAAIDPPPYI
jgi:hypothetical protein